MSDQVMLGILVFVIGANSPESDATAVLTMIFGMLLMLFGAK